MTFLDQVLSDASAVYASTQSLDRATLLRLSDAFGAQLLSSALEILDAPSAEITRMVAGDTRRTVTSVRSTSGMCYVIFPSANRCSCKSWLFRTWSGPGIQKAGPSSSSDKLVTCRHVLAARLAETVMPEKLKTRTVSEEQFVETMATME